MKNYESLSIEIIYLCANDVITTSFAFDSRPEDDDEIASDW